MEAPGLRSYEIPVPGRTQFLDLSPELQVNILGRVSPTASEGVLVSWHMKELADAALMANIRSNNLVDPTIVYLNGKDVPIPQRSKYFKLDEYGRAEYFSPEPGLWQVVQNFANSEDWNESADFEDPDPEYIRYDEYMTIWRFIDRLRFRRASAFVYGELPMSVQIHHGHWERENVSIRVVALNKEGLIRREIIFPSLQEDVYYT